MIPVTDSLPLFASANNNQPAFLPLIIIKSHLASLLPLFPVIFTSDPHPLISHLKSSPFAQQQEPHFTLCYLIHFPRVESQRSAKNWMKIHHQVKNHPGQKANREEKKSQKTFQDRITITQILTFQNWLPFSTLHLSLFSHQTIVSLSSNSLKRVISIWFQIIARQDILLVQNEPLNDHRCINKHTQGLITSKYN